MTSSLVGSEMCIRDSAGFAVGARTTCFVLPLRFRNPAGLLLRLALQRTCLLYTSDAADDM
eukprot:8458497-Prorocentrum_lima.AAC.1